MYWGNIVLVKFYVQAKVFFILMVREKLSIERRKLHFCSVSGRSCHHNGAIILIRLLVGLC